MKSFANWMIVTFMVMFWGFRIAVAYTAGKNIAFITTPINYIAEIVLLFITLVCIILVVKRIIWGGLIYLISYLVYFGTDLFNKIIPIMSGEQIGANVGFDIFISVIALFLAIIVVIDLATDYTKRPNDKKTDWFFNNKDLDREVDEKADRNNYKIY
ncbi:MAG: hypothetical protein IKG14_05360 [Clostridia bacterium]|nr:hypothetical protein [Clostridia bacterium]